VFLLNKDIEQLLNAHGLLVVGPRHTLPNLRRLLAARQHQCLPAPVATSSVGGAGAPPPWGAVQVVEGTGVKDASDRDGDRDGAGGTWGGGVGG
jgi:hypothetical protein